METSYKQIYISRGEVKNNFRLFWKLFQISGKELNEIKIEGKSCEERLGKFVSTMKWEFFSFKLFID